MTSCASTRTRAAARITLWALAWTLVAGCSQQSPRALPRSVYVDKCRGAWAGQMVGVCYGEPYQFRSNGQPITGPMDPWEPQRVAGSLRQDDVYVDLTFLAALEQHGLDISSRQAGQAFARTSYPLWHANYFGRANVRAGIMPPLSGHPKYNRHADDIDFQIEADVFGIICPGLPQESNRLCDIFGHIMNYGDGVYGGMFVAGMYTAAFFESRDVLKVIRAGLACIPEESKYHECMSDTIRWWKENPDDWLATWHQIERKWNDDVDCIPGNPHNIDARINGAYIVVGLLYGQDDFLKVVEICTRCGQDADSSTANAGGIIGCMKGYDGLGSEVTGGIDAIRNERFLESPYSFETLVVACERIAGQVVRRAGGQVTADAYLVPAQQPRRPQTLEQWEDKQEAIASPVTQHEVELWDPRWRTAEISGRLDAGFYPRAYGRTNMLAISPIAPDQPAAIEARLTVPETQKPRLCLEVASDGQHGDYRLRVLVNGEVALDTIVETGGESAELGVDLNAAVGEVIQVRLEFHANDWSFEAAYLGKVEIR